MFEPNDIETASNTCDDVTEMYSELFEMFAKRANDAKAYLNRAGYDSENDDDNANILQPENLLYEFVSGIRDGSELIYDFQQEALYVSNGKILKDNTEAFTCYVKQCRGRVCLRPDGFAYKKAEHTIQHGTMYPKYVELKCRQMMRELCRTSAASTPIPDIYNEAIKS